MPIRLNALPGLAFRPALACGWMLCLNLVHGADYLTPSDVVLPPDSASEEVLDQSVRKGSLRFLGLDFFPRASLTTLYDDNILISSVNQLSDVKWTISPGIAMTAGDISSYLPASVTLAQIRGLFNYSLLDQDSMPQRYLGVEYAPAVNVYTDHSKYNGVDHSAGMSAGYSFSRLALGLEQDFFRGDVKNNQVGDLLGQSLFDTRLRARYEFTDRSRVEIKAQRSQSDYRDSNYKGYEEYRNEDWFDRSLGGRLEVGLGAAFGFVSPQVSADQTYQQALLRGIYSVSGKLNLRASAGIEFRQYESGASGNVAPVLSLEAIYQPRATTTLTLEGHRKEQPSFESGYNYDTLGFTVGARQQLMERIYAQLTAAYDSTEYNRVNSGISNARADNYYSGQANLQYEFNRQVGTTLFYTYRQVASNIGTYSYMDNMVGLQVYWRF